MFLSGVVVKEAGKADQELRKVRQNDVEGEWGRRCREDKATGAEVLELQGTIVADEDVDHEAYRYNPKDRGAGSIVSTRVILPPLTLRVLPEHRKTLLIPFEIPC